jgi:hypothetical protein
MWALELVGITIPTNHLYHSSALFHTVPLAQ